jgi:hypothetical protein
MSYMEERTHVPFKHFFSPKQQLFEETQVARQSTDAPSDSPSRSKQERMRHSGISFPRDSKYGALRMFDHRPEALVPAALSKPRARNPLPNDRSRRVVAASHIKYHKVQQ